MYFFFFSSCFWLMRFAINQLLLLVTLPSTCFHFPQFTLFFCVPFRPLESLSFKVWIIEAYWVWPADGKMGVMDLSMLLSRVQLLSDTCPAWVHSSSGEAWATVGADRQGTPTNASPLKANVGENQWQHLQNLCLRTDKPTCENTSGST